MTLLSHTFSLGKRYDAQGNLLPRSSRVPMGEGSPAESPPPAEGFTPEAGFSVSGDLVHGGEVIISRSSGAFDAKDHQATYFYSDLEDQTVGTNLNYPKFTSAPTITDEYSVIGTKSYKSGPENLGYARLLSMPATNHVYFSSRFRWHEGAIVEDTNTAAANYKGFRIMCDPSTHTAYPDIGFAVNGNNPPWNATPGDGKLSGPIWTNQGGGAGRSTWYTGMNFVPFNTWLRMEMYGILSDPAVANGKHWSKINGVCPPKGWDTVGPMNSPSGTYAATSYRSDWKETKGESYSEALRWTGLRLPFFQRSYQRISSWWDDIYIDLGQNAQARIEVGSASGFDADANVRNPCQYTAWGSSSITVKLNSAGASLTDKGLYYVNGEGVVEKIGVFT